MTSGEIRWLGAAVACALLAGCNEQPITSGGGMNNADSIFTTSCNSDMSRCVSFFPDGRVELKWCDGASRCSIRIVKAADPARARSPGGEILRQELMVAPTANITVSTCDRTFSRCTYIHADGKVGFRLCDAAKQCTTRLVDRADGEGYAVTLAQAQAQAPAPVPTQAPVPAQAGALENLKAGYAARSRGDLEEGIRLYTLAIDAGGLSTRDQAVAHNNRGNAYLDKGQIDRAIQDFDQAIRLMPDYAHAFANRGNAYCDKGQNDEAIRDYTQAIFFQPGYAHAFSRRGRVYSHTGQHNLAIADFRQALTIGRSAEDAIWLFLARERAGGGGRAELMENAKALDLAPWPGAILSFYLGQASEAAVLAAAKDADAWTQRGRECDAFYHFGMERLLHGDGQGAADFFHRSVATERKDFVEYREAKRELAGLGAKP